MKKYILRLDDACERMDVLKWERLEEILDIYNIKPLVGIIPYCQDPMMEKYPIDKSFWNKTQNWIDKEWTIALHGYNHVYTTDCGGINPVNRRSEFAGEALDIQQKKIRQGLQIFENHHIKVEVFFAPSHTFDQNTLKALMEESNIRIISDTISNDIYYQDGFYFVPQQSGRVRKLPFKVCTFCYHPNTMEDADFTYLIEFLKNNANNFTSIPNLVYTKRNLSIYDKFLRKLYFLRKR